MQPRHLAFALFGALLLAAAPTAHAQEEGDDGSEEDPEPEVSSQPDQWDRMLGIAATGAWDGPLGIGSGQIEFAPVRYVNIYAGAGVSRSGVRVGGGLQLRYPVGDGVMGLFAGAGGGPMDWDSRGEEGVTQIHRYWEFALFLNGGVYVEYRWPIGVFGRFSVGVDALVTPDAASECVLPSGGACGNVEGNLYKPVRAFAELSIGYAFDL